MLKSLRSQLICLPCNCTLCVKVGVCVCVCVYVWWEYDCFNFYIIFKANKLFLIVFNDP